MSHHESYIETLRKSELPALAKSAERIAEEVKEKWIDSFRFTQSKSVLLLGHVQSGKTAQMLGIMTLAADKNFSVFLILTTDNTRLQEQTLLRALKSLDSFCVCDEKDEMRFLGNDMRKPVVLVLKKNIRVLKSWKDTLSSSKFLEGRPIFISDDEGDAASLNTQANKKGGKVSAINEHITEIKKLGSSALHMQVTATPQALFLQQENGYRPEDVHYFEPGEGYLGGDFFYGKDESSVIRTTGEEELKDLQEQGAQPKGMLNALASFLIVAGHLKRSKERPSSVFLIHPSVSIKDHETIDQSIKEALNTCLEDLRDGDLESHLKEAWEDLKKTKEDLLPFDECHDEICDILEGGNIEISTINSKSPVEIDYNKGIHIVIGGNSLGRGVTFPNLQTTYYCRKSKSPQADTVWQHCRAFGYDRDPDLARMFLSPRLRHLFIQLNEANKAMISALKRGGVDSLKLIYPKGVKPTRANVVEKGGLNIIAGGVNYFPGFPKETRPSKIDAMVESLNDGENKVSVELIKKLIKLCKSEYKKDWPSKDYIDCIDSLREEFSPSAILVVRKDRDLAKGTRTMLSPDDRNVIKRHQSKIVLSLYRVIGRKGKGWQGSPFWLPNIKFPEGVFYSMEK